MANRRNIFHFLRVDPLVFGAIFGLVFITVGTVAIIFEHEKMDKAAGGIAGATMDEFQVSEFELEDGKIVFDYYVPFDGITRVKLENEDGKKIWQSQYDDQKGDNDIRLNAMKLHHGETYKFTFEYKSQEVVKEVTIE